MGAVAEIKQKTRGISLNLFKEAVQWQVLNDQRVHRGMVTDPSLYAELAKHYLYWTGKMLAILQDAAYQRPNLKPVFDQFLELALRYFENQDRWPRTNQALRYPLTLLVPAYYASRLGELLNNLVKPNLLKVDYSWANGFAKEVIHSAAVKVISEHLKNDMDPIVKATKDEDLFSKTHHPRDLEPFLADDQRRRLELAQTEQTAPAPPPEPLPGPTPTQASPAILEQLTSVLQGKVLRRREEDVGGGVSGVISSTEKKYGLFLYRDGTFRYEERTFRSVSSGGFSVPSDEIRSGEGTWAVELVSGKPALVLRQDGEVTKWWHTEDGGPGKQYLGGEEWQRYIIRE
jgi:hypothetical protein